MLSFDVIIYCYHFPPFFLFPENVTHSRLGALGAIASFIFGPHLREKSVTHIVVFTQSERQKKTAFAKLTHITDKHSPSLRLKVLCNGWEHYVPYRCL